MILVSLQILYIECTSYVCVGVVLVVRSYVGCFTLVHCGAEAERHRTGSNFEVTTSIMPVNREPIASDMAVVTNENTAVALQLQGYVRFIMGQTCKSLALTCLIHGHVQFVRIRMRARMHFSSRF